MRHLDLTGRVFGLLTCLRQARRPGGLIEWECRCVCGALRLVEAGYLTAGRIKSCKACRGTRAVPRDPALLERARQLRESGLTYAAVGRELGISSAAAWQLLHPDYHQTRRRR